MKKVILNSIVLIFCLGQLSAQTSYSLKYFMGGGGFNSFSSTSEPSENDSLLYPININYGDQTYSLTILTLGIQDTSGNFTEIGIGYTQGKHQIGKLVNMTDFTQKGNYFARTIALDVERYFLNKKLKTEKIRTYWGVGLKSMYEVGKITPIENSSVYPNKKQRGGLGTTVLTRLIYGGQNHRWKLEGTFGISAIDVFVVDSYTDNPAFTEGQKRNATFEINMPFEAFAQLGVSFVLNHKKDKEEK